MAIKEGFQFAVGDVTAVMKIVTDLGSGEFVESVLGFNLQFPGQKFGGGVTHALGFNEMDVVLQYKFYKPRNPFRFLAAFENVTWMLILSSILLLAVFFTFTGKMQTFWRNLEYTLWSLFGPFEIKACKVALLTAVVWVTMVWILQQYFGGDMLSAMMEPPPEDVFDTLEQLARKGNKRILAISTEVYGHTDPKDIIENYYKGYSYRDGLMPKTTLLDIRNFLENKEIFQKNIIERNDREKKVALLPRFLAEYFRNLKDEYRNILHVSEHGGDSQPYFFLYSIFANNFVKLAMNDV